MNAHILTLFGEELVPEQLNTAPRKTVAARQEDQGTTGSDVLSHWEPVKQYYAIGEVAELFKVRTSHIRFWTKEFELQVRTTSKGDRLYTPANILELKAIYDLVKERGFTIQGAKARLKDSQRVTAETMDLRQSLLKLRNQLLLIRNKLV
jgi:DNA-binding transcriptional MerR regulator